MPLRRADIAIGLVGDTGSGKSSFINALLGENQAPVSSGIRSLTATVTQYSYNLPGGQQGVALIDTPGFGCYFGSQKAPRTLDILRSTKNALNRNRVQLSYLFIFQNITSTGIRHDLNSTERRLLDRLCLNGDNVVVITTHWDRVPALDASDADELEANLSPSNCFLKYLVEKGKKVVKYRSGIATFPASVKGYLAPAEIVGDLLENHPPTWLAQGKSEDVDSEDGGSENAEDSEDIDFDADSGDETPPSEVGPESFVQPPKVLRARTPQGARGRNSVEGEALCLRCLKAKGRKEEVTILSASEMEELWQEISEIKADLKSKKKEVAYATNRFEQAENENQALKRELEAERARSAGLEAARSKRRDRQTTSRSNDDIGTRGAGPQPTYIQSRQANGWSEGAGGGPPLSQPYAYPPPHLNPSPWPF